MTTSSIEKKLRNSGFSDGQQDRHGSRKRSEFERVQDDIEPLLNEFERFVKGHRDVAKLILIALFTKSHILLEGVPGTAKTLKALVMSRLMNLAFSRIQFTPDLLPADITGQEIFRPQLSEFVVRKGPIFANTVLADEVNRASPKTQAAVLEAMQEGSVTIAGETIPVPQPFLVMATENPLEHGGTYPLPEAQLDRFLFQAIVDNVDSIELLLDIDDVPDLDEAEPMLSAERILELQQLAAQVSASDTVRRYRAELVMATRIHAALAAGASDRRSKLLLRAAKARALINGRSYVNAEDVRELVPDAFRHVLILKDEAVVEGVSVESVIDEVINSVPTPVER